MRRSFEPPDSWYDPPDDGCDCEDECSCDDEDFDEQREEDRHNDWVRSYHDSFGPTGGPW